MTTMNSERLAFLRAIIADPADDTVRLAFADFCDENNDPARAEFIRIQCELAPNVCPRCEGDGRINQHHDPASDTWRGGAKCPTCKGSGDRETPLLDAHRSEWLKGPTCVKCSATGRVHVGHPYSDCPHCHGTGDVGGLTWRFDTSDGVRAGILGPPVVHFARGFPARIEVARLAGCVETFGRLNATVQVPSPWLAAVVAAHPVDEVVPLDTVPWEYVEDGAVESYQWWDRPDSTDDGTGNVPKPLFDLMWAEWVGSRQGDQDGRWLSWKHREDAVDALAEATPQFARQHAQGVANG